MLSLSEFSTVSSGINGDNYLWETIIWFIICGIKGYENIYCYINRIRYFTSVLNAHKLVLFLNLSPTYVIFNSEFNCKFLVVWCLCDFLNTKWKWTWIRGL